MQPPAYAEPVVLFLRIGAMLAVIIVGLLACGRREARIVSGAVLSAVLLSWFGASFLLARADAYVQPASGTANPTVLLAAALPLLVLLPLLTRVRRFADLLLALSPSGVVGVQVFRVLGGIFLFLWADGAMPAVFAWPVGVGDVLVGVFALPVAWLLATGSRFATPAAVAWNLFGMADHLMALALGVLTVPGPNQRLALELPNTLMGIHPMVLIPAFIVPLSLILHSLSLWKLRKARS